MDRVYLGNFTADRAIDFKKSQSYPTTDLSVSDKIQIAVLGSGLSKSGFAQIDCSQGEVVSLMAALPGQNLTDVNPEAAAPFSPSAVIQ